MYLFLDAAEGIALFALVVWAAFAAAGFVVMLLEQDVEGTDQVSLRQIANRTSPFPIWRLARVAVCWPVALLPGGLAHLSRIASRKIHFSD